MKPEKQNIVLGAGYLYFAEEDASGKLGGERYLGDTPGFSITVSSQNVEVYSSDGPIAEKMADIATQVDRSAGITCRNMSAENLALFLLGEHSTVGQTSGTVTAEAHDGVNQGQWYQLGATAENPVGVRDVSAVAVKNDAGTPTTFVETTDYVLDLDLGRVYIVPGGGIADGTNLRIDYSKAAANFDQIVTNNLGAKRGALRYVAANTNGANRDLYPPQVNLRPDGELAMKSRDTVQEMQFTAAFGKRGSLPQLYLNGRPA